MGSKTALVGASLALACAVVSAGPASADPAAPPPAPTTTIDHDGTYVVGVDIAPGTYASAGPVGDGACYWKRLGSLQGNDIIDNALSHQPQVVQIDPADKAFKTSGCQPWQPADPQSAATPAPSGSIAEALLRAYIDSINGGARQFDGAQVPPP